jgi:outer membrane protein OmpA-like peptidoglycan-associated protein
MAQVLPVRNKPFLSPSFLSTISNMAALIRFSGLVAAMVTLILVSVSQANVVGPDAQNFNPTTNGLDFVTVQSSETLKPGIFNFGLFLNYAVNSLPYFNQTTTRLRFNDSLLGLDLNMGVGIMKGWDIGISLPHILTQSVEDQTGARGQFAEVGGTEIRLNTKIRLLGDDSGGVAFVLSSNINRIENNPYSGAGAGPTVNTEIAADTTINRVALGVNAGYRFRSPGTKIAGSVANPLKDQIIGSGAVSYYVPSWDTKFIGEIYGSLPAQASSNDDDDRSLSSAEMLAGVKHDVTTNLALHGGGGMELAQGLASPDWRVYAGLNYTFGPVFKSPAKPSKKSAQPEEPDEELLQQLTPEGPLERFRTQAILFKFDSDEMVGNFAAVLEELAQQLKGGFQELIVEGHTDSIGSEVYNQRLSLKRAEAIRRYMVSKYQFDAKKISPIGYGETRPIADNGNYQGRRLNRRVDFKVRR